MITAPAEAMIGNVIGPDNAHPARATTVDYLVPCVDQPGIYDELERDASAPAPEAGAGPHYDTVERPLQPQASQYLVLEVNKNLYGSGDAEAGGDDSTNIVDC